MGGVYVSIEEALIVFIDSEITSGQLNGIFEVEHDSAHGYENRGIICVNANPNNPNGRFDGYLKSLRVDLFKQIHEDIANALVKMETDAILKKHYEVPAEEYLKIELADAVDYIKEKGNKGYVIMTGSPHEHLFADHPFFKVNSDKVKNLIFLVPLFEDQAMGYRCLLKWNEFKPYINEDLDRLEYTPLYDLHLESPVVVIIELTEELAVK